VGAYYSVIILFSKHEEASKIKMLAERGGFDVNSVCSDGCTAIGMANSLDGGVVICGYHCGDMRFDELYGYLPKGFEMILLASPQRLSESMDGGIISLALPVSGADLIATLQMVDMRVKARYNEMRQSIYVANGKMINKQLVERAKGLLMERNRMSEPDAHKYLQKLSMDSGRALHETAQMVLVMRG
jgi:response regulator NasT